MGKSIEKTAEELLAENSELRIRLEEAEEALDAIRKGTVDAIVVYEPVEQVYAVSGSDQAYRILVEAISEGAAILTCDGSLLYSNQCLARMLGIPSAELMASSLLDFAEANEKEKMLALIGEAQHRQTKGEISLKGKNGAAIHVKLSANPLHIDKTHGICVVITDLTDRKRFEKEIQRHALRLEASNKELQDFAFIASHDLQEPLRKIQTFCNMIQKKHLGSLSEQGQDYMRRVVNAASRMSELLKSLLDYSRIGTHAIGFTPVDLTSVATEAATDLDFVFEKACGKLEIGQLPTLRADAGQMRRLFLNLMSNSLKFHRAGESPLIRVHSQKSGRDYQIFFQDNGIGFDEQFLDRIFAPFQRLHGRDEYVGTGMGLTICRKIIERHGGAITARSAPGQGATFIITLPADGPPEI